MKNVFVIGAGTMGLDIAQVFATAGYNVTAYGRTDASIGKSSAIDDRLQETAVLGSLEGSPIYHFTHPWPPL